LFDNFNLPDLVNYCKQENITYGGKKPVVIKRILSHLKGEKEPEKSPKKRKAASPKIKKTSKKAKTDDKEGEEAEEKEEETKAEETK